MHDLENILSISDLNHEVLVKIFQNHFGTENVQLNDDGDKDQFTGNNDFYNSEIRKAKFNVKVNGEVKAINAVLKTQLNDRFHKVTAKLSTPFTKEVFWYSQASKDLGKLFPEISGR